jgi:hypothetical protein
MTELQKVHAVRYSDGFTYSSESSGESALIASKTRLKLLEIDILDLEKAFAFLLFWKQRKLSCY